MSVVTLTLRDRAPAAIDAALAPDRLTGSEVELARTQVRLGRSAAELGELFQIRAEARDSPAGPELRVETGGAAVHGLGSAMGGGRLVVEGDAGDRVGAEMSGGEIVVRGRCGDHAGAQMSGGLLRVEGDAGHRAGGAYPGGPRGMTGGALLLLGRAGDETGAAMRRGLIAVGACGDRAAFHAIAGTVVVAGDAGSLPGLASKRGSVVLHGAGDPPPSYRFACAYEPPYLRVLLRHLAGPLAFPLAEVAREGRYERWVGDFTEVGKAEVLRWLSR